jgi:internalin A
VVYAAASRTAKESAVPASFILMLRTLPGARDPAWPLLALLTAMASATLPGCGEQFDVYAPIRELKFASEPLARCIVAEAARHGWETAGRMTELRCTNPSGEQVSDLRGIEQLVNLDSLNLAHNAISDITPLADLQLRRLDLGYNRIERPEFHASTPTLLSLSLDHNQIKNLDWITALHNLEHLSASANTISDVSPLSTLGELRSLNLARNRIGSITPLSTLTRLEFLDITSNHIGDLAPLSSFAHLIVLRAGSNKIAVANALVTTSALIELDLSNNAIISAAGLDRLETLERLDLDGNQLTDVEALANLNEVQFISLRHNATLPCASLDRLTSALGATTILGPNHCSGSGS